MPNDIWDETPMVCANCLTKFVGARKPCPKCSQRFKADAGKARPALLAIGMQRALRIVQATMEYGAIKYEEHSWRNVPDGKARYLEAAERHRQERLLAQTGKEFNSLATIDRESGLPHIAHELFCLLCILELDLAEHPELALEDICSFNQPPLGHKG